MIYIDLDIDVDIDIYIHTHTHTMEYYSAIKKVENLVICDNRDGGPRGHYAKCSETEKENTI